VSNTGGCVNGTFNSTDVPKSIPDNNQTGVTSNLSVTGNGTVATLSYSLNLTHTYKGDLKITLIAPNGTTQQVIHNRTGSSADNVIFSNVSSTAFNGTGAAGTWKLLVQDLAAIDVGTVNSWSLNIVGGCQ
jgi:subtilisin-like proprotein convertase family protein